MYNEQIDLLNQIADLVGSEAMPPLNCSVCNRDLRTVFSIALHTVHPDGSLTCRAATPTELSRSGRVYIPLADVVTLLHAARAHHEEEPPF